MRAILTVIGKDRVGIIAHVCTILAQENVNVLDISQTVMGDNFTMTMQVDTSKCLISFEELSALLKASGEEKNLVIRIQREDIFNAMHKI